VKSNQPSGIGDSAGRPPVGVGLIRFAGVTVISVRGELDATTVGNLAEPLLDAVRSGEEVIVDLSGCEYVDSSVVAAIVVAHQTMQRDGAALRLVARLESQPVRVLRITDLYAYLPVFFTLGAAVDDAQTAITEAPQ
jgi:anti-sigma B factor antagonist